MIVTLFEKKTLVTLVFVHEMGPKLAFINKCTLMMTREVIDVIEIENVNNVVQLGPTDIVIRETRVNWWMVRTFILKQNCCKIQK